MEEIQGGLLQRLTPLPGKVLLPPQGVSPGMPSLVISFSPLPGSSLVPWGEVGGWLPAHLQRKRVTWWSSPEWPVSSRPTGAPLLVGTSHGSWTLATCPFLSTTSYFSNGDAETESHG